MVSWLTLKAFSNDALLSQAAYLIEGGKFGGKEMK